MSILAKLMLPDLGKPLVFQHIRDNEQAVLLTRSNLSSCAVSRIFRVLDACNLSASFSGLSGLIMAPFKQDKYSYRYGQLDFKYSLKSGSITF